MLFKNTNLSKQKIAHNMKKILDNAKKTIIGAVHFPPLLGYHGFPGFEIALKNAKQDVRAFEQGKADAIIFENNYDVPHKTNVDPGTIASMAYLCAQLKRETKLPIGISVLWNDYQSAFAIANIVKAQFIRVPVFVDKIKTKHGIITGNPKDVLFARKKLKADDVLIFADIHVKHAQLLSKRSLISSAKEAQKQRADAIIITGSYTAQAPALDDLASVASTVRIPVLAGSGVDSKNISTILKYCKGVIVSTSLKKGLAWRSERNVKSYEQRIGANKVKQLIQSAKNKLF
ncbi:MAG: hypothetical protein CO042_00450 [Parcubacteria group bacterium CG_4_9_14_0_2_um_filter_41_8]|nr:MAG: hypothetical protein CO042_00450 [Parcubacteria group bacterium CG_4_9_14_0_2_um_filter_41_8]